MPISLPPPVYGASRHGLVARYNSVQFSSDGNIFLPLYGSFQGDPVKPASLLIDNYNNGIPVSYVIGGMPGYIPAYTAEYVSVERMDSIVLSASDTIAINLEVHDLPMDGTRTRGIAPNGISDPMWANVLGLWHFNGNNNSSVGIDSKNSGLYFNRGAPLISSTQAQFGGTSAHNTTAGPYPVTESLPVNGVLNADYTFEFSAYPVNPFLVGMGGNPAGINSIALIANDSNAISGHYFAWESNGTNIRFSIYELIYEGGQNFHMNFVCGTAYAYSLNAWYSIGVTTVGGFSIYVNGSLAATGGVRRNIAQPFILFPAVFNTASGSFQYPSGEIYIDEMRLTIGTRFTKNYVVSGQEFPNQ